MVPKIAHFQEVNDPSLHILGTPQRGGTRACIVLTARQTNKHFCFSIIFPALKMPA